MRYMFKDIRKYVASEGQIAARQSLKTGDTVKVFSEWSLAWVEGTVLRVTPTQVHVVPTYPCAVYATWIYMKKSGKEYGTLLTLGCPSWLFVETPEFGQWYEDKPDTSRNASE